MQAPRNSFSSSFSSKLDSGKTSKAPSSSSQVVKMMGMTMLLFLLVGTCSSYVLGNRPLSKRSFFDIQCKGVYNKEIFAKLENICHDCYNLYRDSELYSLCR